MRARIHHHDAVARTEKKRSLPQDTHASYSFVMMEARAHGASEGAMATYGWLERNDTRGIVEVLESSETVGHLYALGESMGAAIALQSAAVEPRIEAVAAESSFSNLRE